MVSFISKGRMGNFMFVAAAAYAYCLKHKLEFHVQTEALDKQWPLYLQHLKNSNWNPDLETVYINDNQHPFRELEFKEEWRDKNIIIGTKDIQTGYFQSFRYIQGYEDQIRDAFGFKSEKKHGVIGVHQRYGDYRKLKDKHPPITPFYLHNAINFFRSQGYKKFMIFSDEIDYAKKEIFLAYFGDDYNSFHEMKFIEGQSELEDFSDLINCEGNIVSNSSFSVLAALLSPKWNKGVVCPHEENYFRINNKFLDVRTLYPPHWYRIKY